MFTSLPRMQSYRFDSSAVLAMKRNRFRILALLWAFALAPSLAHAFTGNLITCTPSAGRQIVLNSIPGLDCPPSILNKFSVTTKLADGNSLNGCAANALAPWGSWSAGGYIKISSAQAATITDAVIALKGTMFGTCDFHLSPPADAAAPSAAGKLTLYDGAGNKVAKGNFFGKVTFTLAFRASSGLQFDGVMSKGFVPGAAIHFTLENDSDSPSFGDLFSCNFGLACPPPLPGPIPSIGFITTASSMLSIDE